jgi:hypothetical protein
MGSSFSLVVSGRIAVPTSGGRCVEGGSADRRRTLAVGRNEHCYVRMFFGNRDRCCQFAVGSKMRCQQSCSLCDPAVSWQMCCTRAPSHEAGTVGLFMKECLLDIVICRGHRGKEKHQCAKEGNTREQRIGSMTPRSSFRQPLRIRSSWSANVEWRFHHSDHGTPAMAQAR